LYTVQGTVGHSIQRPLRSFGSPSTVEGNTNGLGGIRSASSVPEADLVRAFLSSEAQGLTPVVVPMPPANSSPLPRIAASGEDLERSTSASPSFSVPLPSDDLNSQPSLVTQAVDNFLAEWAARVFDEPDLLSLFG